MFYRIINLRYFYVIDLRYFSCRNEHFDKSVILVLMEESKVSMMKRKSIQEAINKGESLPAAVERSETGSNKHNLGYQVELIS